MDQYIGKLLDNRYEILSVIGTGGMAMVYKAYCHRLNRMVAIKILKTELAQDAEFRRRFQDEGQAVAMLSHPNIVSVYDVSRGDDIDYIVMELIDGITLKQYMKKKEGPLSWREALHYITQIVKALGHAHSRGIIHRDIKPQNIMVLRDGSVKVADFGIARVLSAVQNTLTQEALGSVHYISPEQARGSRTDTRTDLYSAGVVLYEMLTGQLPFDGDTPVAVAIQHINSVPVPPREINPEIPVGLESITMKAMAGKLSDRYSSADEMLNDLEEFRKDPSITFPYATGSAAALDNASEAVDEPTRVLTKEETGAIRNPSSQRPRGDRKKQKDELEDTGEERGGISPLVTIGVILVFLIGVGYFIWATLLGGLFQSTPEYSVPNLVGHSLEDVLADQDITDVFNIEEIKTESSNEYAEGIIIDQDPDSSTTVKGENTTISVTVSSGQQRLTMIDVENDSYQQALTMLENMGLEVDVPDYETSDTVTKGYVISFTPLEGTQMSPGDTVHLIISLGPEVKKVTVPPLVNQTEETVKKMLDELNLTGNFTEVNSDQPAGTVIYQSLAAGTEVEEGSSISLQVSSGPSTDETGGTATVKTKTLTISLPTDRSSVTVRVTVDDVVKYENAVDTTANSKIYPSVDGSGVQHVCIYFDGVLSDEYDLDFDS